MTERMDIRIEGFQIGSAIGKGSIGTVYNATDSSGNNLAVKIMKPNPFLENDILDAMIERAILSSKASSCARVVKVHKVGKTPDFYYIIMDFMPGGTLERIIEDKSYPMDRKLEIALSLSHTIECIHSKGLIHADLKPANIMLDSEDVPYLTDFYYSTLKKGKSIMPQGTPRYMSPEQAMGLFVTSSSDIYSFGVLLYELLTGEFPYSNKSGNIAGMITTVSECTIIPPEKVNKKIDGGVSAMLMKLLQKKPEARYQNMQQVSKELQSCISGKKADSGVDGTFWGRLFHKTSKK